jgi:ornithine carbamoyltransferase
VINGLTDSGHPVQLVADLFTIEERLGSVPGKVVLFVGDGSSNMARSWIEAAPLFQFTLRLASPPGYEPPESELRAAGERVLLTRNPLQGAEGADVIATDVWTSMGQEAEAHRRRSALKGYSVDQKLLEQAKPGCIVLHCLPAHRGEEIAAEVMDGPQSAVFQEAENRLHVQKALLEQLLLNP